MAIRIVDSEDDSVVLDVEGSEGEAPMDITGTSSQEGVSGVVYQGVKAWIAPGSRVHDWEPEEMHVFVEWTDKSTTKKANPGIVHRLERPLPGGGMGRFLVTAS